MVTCYSTSEKIFGRRSGILGRRLAGGEQEEDEYKSFSAVLSDCLDLQAEIGYQADESRLPQKGEAISNILADIRRYEETVQAAEGIKSPSPPSIPTEALLDAEFQEFTLSELLGSGLTHFTTDPLTAFEQADVAPVFQSTSSYAEWLISTEAAEGQKQIDAALFSDSLAGQEGQEIASEGSRKKRTFWEAGFGDLGAQAKRQEVSPSESDEAHSQWSYTEQRVRGDIVAAALATAGVQPEAPESLVTQASPASGDSSGELPLSRSLEGPYDPSKVLVGFVEDFKLIPFDPMGHETSSEQPSSVPTTNLADHRDYRIPFVDRKHIRRTFNMRFAFEDTTYKPLMPTLRHMRALLALQTLSADQAEQLMSDSEHIVSYLVQTQRDGVAHKALCRALWTLGRRYVLFDAVACAIQALGPAMTARLWWPQLAAMIPCEYPEPKETNSPKRFQRVTVLLRLISALKLLKSGIRPAAEDTLSLKRDLFSRSFTSKCFKSKTWDDWREAD
ncbi:hypothetical protein Emag_000564 [Eimeria magna]